MLRTGSCAIAVAAILNAGTVNVATTKAADDLPPAPQAGAAAEADAQAGADVDANAPALPEADADIEAQTESSGTEGAVQGTAETPQLNEETKAGVEADAEANPARQDATRKSRARADAKAGQGRTGAAARPDLSRRPALGVTFRTQGDGMIIDRVYPNSPAANMGLRSGDRIISLNGDDFDDTQAFISAAGQVSLDQDVEIVYRRNGQRSTKSVRFAPWTEVFVDGDVAIPRQVSRPDLDEDDAIEEPREEARDDRPEVEIDNDGVEIDRE